jgi:hypothetical protein
MEVSVMELTIYFSAFFKKWNWTITSCDKCLSDEEIRFLLTNKIIGKVDRLIDLPAFPENVLKEAFITIV